MSGIESFLAGDGGAADGEVQPTTTPTSTDDIFLANQVRQVEQGSNNALVSVTQVRLEQLMTTGPTSRKTLRLNMFVEQGIESLARLHGMNFNEFISQLLMPKALEHLKTTGVNRKALEAYEKFMKDKHASNATNTVV